MNCCPLCHMCVCIQGYRPAGEDRVPYQHALLGAHPGGGQATHRLR